MNLKINSKQQGNITVLQVDGEVDLYSSPQVRTRVLHLVESQSPNIVVDLQDVRYMDSSGVATLIEGYKLCQKNNGRFVLAGLKPEVREVFELTRLDRVFEIYDTSQLALESIA